MPILVDLSDSVASVVIDREHRRNALDNEALEDLIAAFEGFRRQEVTAVVISGKGIKAFSAGSDLKAANLIAVKGEVACRARRSVRVHIREPAGDAIVKTKVTVSGGGVVRRAKVVKRGKGEGAIVPPSAIPGTTFVVRVTLTTALGHTIKSKRTYRHCTPVDRHRKRHGAHA